MTAQWKEFLYARGANFAGSVVRDFGDVAAERRAARDADVLVDLSSTAIIRVDGPDAANFLNGQLSVDTHRLDLARSRLAAWCNPKGRMLALFRVFRRPQSFLLQLPAALADDIATRLRVYVLRAKVTLTVDHALACFGIIGDGAPALLREAIGAPPQNPDDVIESDGVICTRVAGPRARFEMIAASERAAPLWLDLANGAVPTGTSTWVWHDILAGIPAILPETRDAFVPQMANLDLLDAIDFDKGCYTGQEIVARLHYRGRLKQRLYRARAALDAVPQPGDPIYASSTPGQAIGTVVMSAADPDGSTALLGVIHCDNAARDELRLYRPDGPRLTLEPLPQALPA